MVNIFLQFAIEETAQKSGIAVLGINPVSLLLQFITFLILFFLLKKFAFESIVKMLDERRKTIDKGVNLGIKMQEEQAKLEEDIDKALHKARAEADKIVASAKAEASEMVKEAEGEASAKGAKLIEDAKLQIESATAKARQELRQEMTELVATATGALLQEKIDSRKDASLLAKALDEVKR